MSSLSFPLQAFFASLVGLAFGSFGTMLVYRMPKGKTFLGRSHCTQCGAPLRLYHLIPLLSFLALRGKCHSCSAHISWRYPIIEGITAFCFVLLIPHLEQQGWIALLFLAAAVYLLILIAFYAAETKRIPDLFLLLLLLSVLLYQSVMSSDASPLIFRSAAIGAAIPLGFFGFLWVVSRGTWIGSGDVLLGTAVGALLGTERTVLALFFAYLAGGFAALLLLSFGTARRGSTIAFAPYIAGGALLARFVGEPFLLRYGLTLSF